MILAVQNLQHFFLWKDWPNVYATTSRSRRMHFLQVDFGDLWCFAAKFALLGWPCAEAKLLMRVIVGLWDARGSLSLFARWSFG